MTQDEFLLFVTDSERITEIGATSLNEQVPSCPEWVVADFMSHVGWAHRVLVNHAGLPDGGRTTETITVTHRCTKWRRSTDDVAADVTVRGSLSDLYLYLWGRQPAEAIDVRGDERLLARWQAAAAF